jgi:hypothetical protein
MKKVCLSLCLFLSFHKDIYNFSQDVENVFLAQSHFQKNQSFLRLVQNSTRCHSWQDVMKVALDAVRLEGFYLEMGVFQGNTINLIASVKQQQTIYGFDSFEGLPEAWSRDDTALFAKGFFAVNNFPKVASNVQLIQGWFDKSLPVFKDTILNDQTIAFMHVDCDIYSSTKTIFDVLGDNIIPGTILVFDELYNYPGFDRHEIKALYEFLKRKNYSVEYLAYNAAHEQVALKIVEKK